MSCWLGCPGCSDCMDDAKWGGKKNRKPAPPRPPPETECQRLRKEQAEHARKAAQEIRS